MLRERFGVMWLGSLDKNIYAVFAFDILFMPFILPIPIPISFLVIPVWVLSLSRSIPQAVLQISIVGCGFALLSFVNGLGVPGGADLLFERAANTAIIIFMFVSFLLSRTTAVHPNTVCKFLYLWIAFNLIMAIVFFVQPSSYFALRQFWTFGHEVGPVDELSILTRFTGIMSDPNNLAVSICAAAAFVSSFGSASHLGKITVIVVSGAIVVATMSATGAVCYSILVLSYVIGSNASATQKIFMIGGLAIGAVLVYLVVSHTDVFAMSVERIANSDSDSRLSRWSRALDADKIIGSLFIGDGGSILLDGFPYKPHNGHIHIIFSFGFICYICFASIFLRFRPILGWASGVFMLIIFLGFTVNVGIYEHRFAGLWVILVSSYHELASRAAAERRRHRYSVRFLAQ